MSTNRDNYDTHSWGAIDTVSKKDGDMVIYRCYRCKLVHCGEGYPPEPVRVTRNDVTLVFLKCPPCIEEAP